MVFGIFTLTSLKQYFSYIGKDEAQVEQLQSVLAQLEYTHQINAWQTKGVQFKD